MRPLALVLAVTLFGCIPMPTAAEAHYGNGLWFIASVAVIQNESGRNCNLHSMGEPDPFASEGCKALSSLAITTAEIVAVAALIGVGRTLAASYHLPPTTTTPRSR